MQLVNSGEISSEHREFPVKPEEEKSLSSSLIEDGECGIDDGVGLDISGKSLDFRVVENAKDSVEDLYFYKNVYNLIPKSLGPLRRLRTLKFFGNEINLFAPEFGNLTGLERLQMKISSPGIGGLTLHKLKDLKELELCKVPPRPSAFPILSEIAGLKCLTKLAICHFSIRYLPPEIGCLENLEDLDLSFNKIKTLPSEISYLNCLISLNIANNKLVELPPAMSSLSRLEKLDLSNNRLTSLGSLELSSMHKLQNLNLQYNIRVFEIPSWICCNLEGNGRGTCTDDSSSLSVEMDVYETSLPENDGTLSHGCHITSSSLTISSSNNRCFAARKSGKRWKRRYYLQQKARLERLNNSRKWKGLDHTELLSKNMQKVSEPGNLDSLSTESCTEPVSDNANLDDDNTRVLSKQAGNEKSTDNVNEEAAIKNELSREDCCSAESKDGGFTLENRPNEQDEASCSETLKFSSKSKRHSDQDLNNPKPCKSRKPIGDTSLLSCKYSNISFCGIEDHLPDGFYDAGRDRPFVRLESYEKEQCLSSREVIVLDRESDEELDAITLSAQALVFHLKQLNNLTRHGNPAAVDNLQIASLLALFVSDHFGGSDRSSMVERTRKSVSGSNYQKPFVCTCSTGSSNSFFLFH